MTDAGSFHMSAKDFKKFMESQKQKPTSYHDKIQKVARAIEAERAKKYANQGGTTLRRPTIKWTELQQEFLYAAIYKLLRVKNDTCDVEKALDDILDAYNYCALLYSDLTK